MPSMKAKKRKHDAQAGVAKVQKILKSPDSPFTNGPLSLSTVISEEELEVTVDTLVTLAAYPGLIKSKPCKGLRVAVFDFKSACTTGLNVGAGNLTARVSGALADEKYIDARIALAEMRIRNEMPKVGALCRWVRDLDVVSGVAAHPNGTSTSRITGSLEKMRVLDAILRVIGIPDPVFGASNVLSGPIAVQPIWNLRGAGARLPIRQSVLDKTIFESQEQTYRDKFHVIETTPGAQRKPPNHHPAIIYLTSNNAIHLSESPQISHHQHPNVPNLSLIKDVLSLNECKSIIAATESIGFIPDAPIKDDGSASSILAHNVYWMVDQPFHDTLWKRVRPYIPSFVDGKAAHSINRRFRVYRYVPGAEYRCHIDGAWPPSGIHPVTNAYQYDSSAGKQSSLFTFLIYLNDEFDGGETTFVIPSIRDGIMNAYPVKPIMGSVLMFPHGETRGALVHEGTGVQKGAKYVIRTDVEYNIASE